MRDLSEQEIKDLYQTEYDSQAPDVWADIERKLKLKAAEAEQGPDVKAAEAEQGPDVKVAEAEQELEVRAAEAEQGPEVRAAGAEQEPDVKAAEAHVHGRLRDAAALSASEPDVLEFPKVGRKRWVSVIGSVAACFVIIGAYMWQGGYLPFMSGDKSAVPMTAEECFEESDDTAAAPDESLPGEASGATEQSAELFDGVDDTKEGYVNGMTATQGAAAEDKVFICVDGHIYACILVCQLRTLDLEGMEYIGSAVPVEKGEMPKVHLQVSSPDISGEVYFDGSQTVYVVDELEETAYIFMQE